MAITIPTNKNMQPVQNASDAINPARYFGNQNAQQFATPNVIGGMGGYATDTSNVAKAIGNIGEAITSVANDFDRKDRALRKANETLAFVEAGQNHQSDWMTEQETIKKMLIAGEITADEAQRRAEKSIGDLNLKHFGPDKFTDEDIQLKSKIQSVEIQNKYSHSFKKDVVHPYQVTKYSERLTNVTNGAIQSTSDAGRLGNSADALETYLKNRETIVNTYGSVDAQMLIPADRLQKDVANRVRDNARSVIDGILARDFIPGKDGKYDSVKGAKIKAQSLDEALALLRTNPQLRVDIGVDADNIIARLEDRKAKQLEFVQRQSDLVERRNERLRNERDKSVSNNVLLDLTKNGVESRYMNEETIYRLNLPPEQTTMLIEKSRRVANGELTNDQAYRTVETAVKTGQSLARPTKVDAENLDKHYQVTVRSPEFKNMTPEQQSNHLATTYGQVGWVPEKYKNDLIKNLRSSHPAVVKGAMLQFKKLEDVDPRILSAFGPEDKAFYSNIRAGIPLERAQQLRDEQTRKTSDDIKRENEAYTAAHGVKAHAVYEKNKTEFEKRVRSQNSFTEFGTPVIPKSMVEDFDRRVREYFPLVGNDVKRAQEAAFKDMSSKTGTSSINGSRTYMMNPPEAVYRGVKPDNLKLQYQSAVTELQEAIPALKGKDISDFGIVTDGKFSSDNPRWQITVNDGDGNFVPVSMYSDKGPAYFRYDPTGDIQKKQEETQKSINKAKENRAKSIDLKDKLESGPSMLRPNNAR